MCSFLKCPDDLSVMLWLLGISFFVALFILMKSKNRILALMVFSIFSNTILFLISISGSLIFRIYGVEWLQYFSIFVWPLINIILIIWYVRNKKQ